jgi:hypothetical protein
VITREAFIGAFTAAILAAVPDAVVRWRNEKHLGFSAECSVVRGSPRKCYACAIMFMDHDFATNEPLVSWVARDARHVIRQMQDIR